MPLVDISMRKLLPPGKCIEDHFGLTYPWSTSPAHHCLYSMHLWKPQGRICSLVRIYSNFLNLIFFNKIISGISIQFLTMFIRQWNILIKPFHGWIGWGLIPLSKHLSDAWASSSLKTSESNVAFISQIYRSQLAFSVPDRLSPRRCIGISKYWYLQGHHVAIICPPRLFWANIYYNEYILCMRALWMTWNSI